MLQKEKHASLAEDVFTFLRDADTLPYDFIILDPPAFAKRQKDVKNALRGYREINSQVMKKISPNSMLLTCSCSYHVQQDQFLHMLKEAALLSNRHVRVLTGHHSSFDHPLSLTHPETEYLKSYLLYVQ